MTELTTLLETATELLNPWAKHSATPAPNRIDVDIEAKDLQAAVQQLIGWGYLAAITGLDLGAESGLLEVLYHFCSGPAIVTLRVRVPRAESSIPTVCGVITYASMFERELSEMFGITVVDTPNNDKLFLPDDWPAGVYPLRKDTVLS